jgi:cysteine desulfurase
VNSQRIYLDNAATTMLRPEVAEAMREAADVADFNPSSLHAEGRRAAALLDKARDRAAKLLGAARNEIVFTSGGTESDNLAILGIVRGLPSGSHVVATAVEHHAVRSAMEQLGAEGYEATILPVGSDGRLDLAEFVRALRPATAFASVMLANNETGAIQPVAQAARAARDRGVLIHSDAVQAPAWIAVDVDELAVDALSLSAHKIGGPKGVGLLYTRRSLPIAPLVHGGGQEFARRPGTQNVIGIVGMVRALELAVAERGEAARSVGALRDRLEAGIRSAISEVRINGDGPRLPNILNVSFAGVESQALLIALDLAGVAVSAGSACASGSLEPSHVLAAMGLEPRWSSGAIRFSLGRTTSASEIDRVLAILPSIVASLRSPAVAVRGDG